MKILTRSLRLKMIKIRLRNTWMAQSTRVFVRLRPSQFVKWRRKPLQTTDCHAYLDRANISLAIRGNSCCLLVIVHVIHYSRVDLKEYGIG